MGRRTSVQETLQRRTKQTFNTRKVRDQKQNVTWLAGNLVVALPHREPEDQENVYGRNLPLEQTEFGRRSRSRLLEMRPRVQE